MLIQQFSSILSCGKVGRSYAQFCYLYRLKQNLMNFFYEGQIPFYRVANPGLKLDNKAKILFLQLYKNIQQHKHFKVPSKQEALKLK